MRRTSHPFVRKIRHRQQDARFILRGHKLGWARNPDEVRLPLPMHRIVTDDDGVSWFEVGFAARELLIGGADVGWEDLQQHGFLYLEYSTDLKNWATRKFQPAPVPVVENASGYEYWGRAENPSGSDVRTGSLVLDMVSGDPRNAEITGVTVADVALTLPNAPYHLPADAAQLQADIIAAGYPGATVTAESASRWTITVPDVDFTLRRQTSRVSWPQYELPEQVDPLTGEMVTPVSSGLDFAGSFVTAAGTPINPRGFARLRFVEGRRFGGGTELPSGVWLPDQISNPLPGDGGGDPNPTPIRIPRPTAWPHPPAVMPGSAATAPNLAWSDRPTSISGEWYRNGVATGVTSPTFTDAVDGDVLQYREVAVNSVGPSTYDDWPEIAVSRRVATLQQAAGPELSALLTGLPGGAVNMAVFSSRDDATPSYVRNPQNWAAGLVDGQLESALAWKSSSFASYGGVLITPQHVLYCQHQRPEAEGTNPAFPTRPPVMLRWVLANNTVVEVEQIAQSTSRAGWPGYYEHSGPIYPDLCVATLAQPVDTLGVTPVPILGLRNDAEAAAFRFNSEIPIFSATQGWGRPTPHSPPTPISDYPAQNPAMYAVGPGTQSSAPFSLFGYRVHDGDSGTPTFVLHRGQVYLEGIMVFGSWGRVFPGMYLDDLNGMLAAADADAVARGRIPAPTGYTITGSDLTYT